MWSVREILWVLTQTDISSFLSDGYHRVSPSKEASLGQRIEIESSQVVDDSVILSTNRSLTGTTGEGYGTTAEATASGTFAGGLAADLFESDEALRRVYIESNVVVLQRDGGWTDDVLSATESVVGDFFLFYPAV